MIQIRPRRLRTTPAMRRLVREVEPRASQLVLPVFVAEAPGAISSMPGVHRHDLEGLRRVAELAVSAGIGGVMVFGVPDDADKDETGSQGWAEDGILQRGLRAVRDAVGAPVRRDGVREPLAHRRDDDPRQRKHDGRPRDGQDQVPPRRVVQGPEPGPIAGHAATSVVG